MSCGWLSPTTAMKVYSHYKLLRHKSIVCLQSVFNEIYQDFVFNKLEQSVWKTQTMVYMCAEDYWSVEAQVAPVTQA